VGGSYAATGLPNAISTTAYDAANELTQWGTVTPTYDSNGNMVSDGTNSYVWNARNQLVSMNLNGDSFQYDPFGRRVGKTIVASTTNYMYDGANPVQELSGSTVTANLLTGEIDEYFTRTDSSGAANLLTDALGSTLALTNASGSTLASFNYEPFGKTTITGSSASTYQYTGRENDGTGVYYYRARYYSPTLQRFVSEDPLALQASTSLYRYVSNSPVNAKDPRGLCQVSVGHHSVIPGFPSGSGPQHTYIILGGRYDKERYIFDAGASGPILPFISISDLQVATGPLAPGLDITKTVNNEPAITVTGDDGRTCHQDQQNLDNTANSINNAKVPYYLSGPNRNSATNAGLMGLGINWTPPFSAPGWPTIIPH
jgi:RHS repeat-associated protein